MEDDTLYEKEIGLMLEAPSGLSCLPISYFRCLFGPASLGSSKTHLQVAEDCVLLLGNRACRFNFASLIFFLRLETSTIDTQGGDV